jgi:hypothetical protein
VEAVVEAAQVNHHVVAQVLTQIQRQVTHQAHWERTAQAIPETVVEVEPVAAEPTEAQEVQEPRVMQEDSAAIQDQTRYPVEARKTTVREGHQVVQTTLTIQQELP